MYSCRFSSEHVFVCVVCREFLVCRQLISGWGILGDTGKTQNERINAFTKGFERGGGGGFYIKEPNLHLGKKNQHCPLGGFP